MNRHLLLVGLILSLYSVTVFAQTPDVTFETVKLAGIGSISIPSIMELQSGLYKELSDKYSKELGFDASGAVIFQQKGRNELFTKSPTYARVIIEEALGKPGEYRKITSKIVLTKKELEILNNQAKTEVENDFQKADVGLKLLRWDFISVVTVNGRNALKVAYLRQLNSNPPVYVETYTIDNYDRRYGLTMSYRQEDASIWKEVLNTTKNSFTITIVKRAIPKNKRNK